VDAWASCYPDIVHRLSGGLDSSIVLGCLREAPSRPRITSLNYFAKGADGDERRFARAAAAAAHCRLIERERYAQFRLEALWGIAKCPCPSMYLGHVELGAAEGQLAREVGAGAIFGGGGGDPLFFQCQHTLAAVDYAYRHGPRVALWRIAQSAAKLE